MMGSRINSVNPRDFAPAVYTDSRGKEFSKMPGRKRKVPREVRAQIYQLDLTIRETRHEIMRLLDECGIAKRKDCQAAIVARIRKERGK